MDPFEETGLWRRKLVRKLMLLPIIGLFKHTCPNILAPKSSSDADAPTLLVNGGKYTR